MKKKDKVVVIITIIVILALLITSTVLQILNKDPLENLKKKKFIETISGFKEDLNEFIEAKKDKPNFDIEELNARREAQNRDYDLEDIFPTIKDEYLDKVEVKKGKLIFVGKDKKEEQWYKQAIDGEGQVDNREPVEKNENSGN